MHFKLANLIFNGSDAMLQYPLLCYRATEGLVIPTSNDAIEIMKSTNVDFTTYFNALSIYKWRKYTTAKAFLSSYRVLRLRLNASADGYANNYSWIPSTIDGSAVSLQRSDEWSTAEIELSFVRERFCTLFNISTEGPVNIRNAYYYCDCEELDIHPVELALATTTFKKKRRLYCP